MKSLLPRVITDKQAIESIKAIDEAAMILKHFSLLTHKRIIHVNSNNTKTKRTNTTTDK
jgi:hypothetical protein